MPLPQANVNDFVSIAVNEIEIEIQTDEKQTNKMTTKGIEKRIEHNFLSTMAKV